jgi:hypothetical protein
LVITPRRLRAPAEDGAVVAAPPLAEVGFLLAANRQRLEHFSTGLGGRSWAEVRREARKAVVAEARSYLQECGEPAPDAATDLLFLAGHQPELFHPGVWVKNFALNGVARRYKATPINLVVDNDTVKSVALRLPLSLEQSAAEPGKARALVEAFDRAAEDVPYEERQVRDEGLFSTLPERAAAVTRGWRFRPILPVYWGEALRAARRTGLLGERMASSRRALERAWGCHNLELPLSRVCRTEPFAWFACHLLADLPRFHAIHNECLREYRRLYGIRSRAHPVPNLGKQDEWLEAPLWAWRANRPRRQPIWARRRGEQVELRAGSEAVAAVRLASGDTGCSVKAWQDLDHCGLKVRTRALTTTLFARLFVGDLFIHGIGGAKYDELTDEIMRRFYGVEPPGFLVLSATLELPMPAFSVSPGDVRNLAREARDLLCNPQRHLGVRIVQDSEAAELAAHKSALIALEPADGHGRREKYRALHAVTERLRPFLADRERSLHQELALRKNELEANAVLRQRDYAFCLYPEEKLRPFCTAFLEGASS